MPEIKDIITTKRCVLAAAVVAGLGTWIGLQQSGALATPPPAAPPAPAPAAPAAAQSASSEPVVATTNTTAVPGTARITFTTMPPSNATVTWGGTRLGRITPGSPLVVVRPRDSGPLDVVVRAPGYMPVQTRAHTFADSRVQVKLTTPEQKSTLLGYRQPIDAGTPISADGGVPSELPPPLSDPLSPYNSTSPLLTPAPAPAPAVGP